MLSDQEKTTLESYNKIAQAWASGLYENFWQPQYRIFLKYLPAGKIIDLGCGNGRDSFFLSGLGFKVVGIDISEEMIKLAKVKSPTADFYEKSFYKINFPPSTFDGFWAANSLLHISRKNIKKVLKNIKLTLKTGAVGFIAIKEGLG